MKEKLKAGILGGTGMVGQRFISLLENHPWFEVTVIAASPRSAGKTYEEAVYSRWKIETPIPQAVKKHIVKNVKDIDEVSAEADLIFSAVDMSKEEVLIIEEAYAKKETPVISNNKSHRWTPDVPMIVPEINPEHCEIIPYQRERLGTKKGFIAVNSNCSIQSYIPALNAWKEYGPKEVVASTYQAISGAGKNFDDWPEMKGNVIPYIGGGEEEKSEREPLRIFGEVKNGTIVSADKPLITSQCIRVPVLYGHLASVFVNFSERVSKEELIRALREYKSLPKELGLPSAPGQFMQYFDENDRPQPALDAGFENGMGISYGRLREDTYFDYKFIGLSHNTIRGAAGGAILTAELLKAKGYL
ncbi:MAG: aspartate-semialdehyde dehydrogenase [Lachnoclostridium sp.]|jgi:aspartate-semialdehyde dehydrogenase|nr:aspartate-semialdehyde dehydrogenase [Lachnoclostridium sp.]